MGADHSPRDDGDGKNGQPLRAIRTTPGGFFRASLSRRFPLHFAESVNRKGILNHAENAHTTREGAVRLASHLRYSYLAYFSKPAHERVLYRVIRRTSPRRILEIGIGDLERSLRLIHLASRFADGAPIRYAAIDLFEARTPRAGRLSLKDAHRALTPTPARVQLIPGEPLPALRQAANSLPDVDLLLISAVQSDAALEGAWFYFPRMLHAASAVLRESAETDSGLALVSLEGAEIERRARSGRRRAA